MAKKETTGNKLERHPLSEKYGPKMSDEELLGLGLDIKAHGQHDDIILYEGKVLAGWNRYMGALQQGVKPRTREMEKGANPVAVAFGTNFVRRRLSSVQKAFYGAQFAVDSGTKQVDVAKLMGCNLNRLNQCVQLLKLETDDSQKAIETLRTNPDISSARFDEMMLECGITRASKAPAPAPLRTGTHNDDDDGLGDLGDLGEDDLTGGAVDDLLDGGEDEPDLAVNPGKRKPREIGEDSPPLPDTGGKRGSMTNPHETQVSRVAKAFKGLPAEEQAKFVKFVWGKLKVALDTAITTGEVTYEVPEADEAPAPRNPKKPPAKKGAKVPTLPPGVPDPSLIARNKPEAEDDTLAPKKPAAKKAAPAKKAAAKKAAPKKTGGKK